VVFDPELALIHLSQQDRSKVAITLRSEVESSDGGEIALAVHDQRDRPLMTRPMPIARVRQGRESVVFRPTVKTLDSDVREVVVEASLMTAIRSRRRPRPGEVWWVKFTCKVR